MMKMRAILVGLTAASLLGLPAVALASAPTTGAQQAVTRHSTSIRWMPFRHIQGAGFSITVRGQVVSHAQGKRGALGGVNVRLYRRLDGSATWVYLATHNTGSSDTPQFRFLTESRQNADYKVVFGGNAAFAPTSGTTWLNVYRLFNGHLYDGTSTATYKGNVTPYYTNKQITLQRRACVSCSYVDYRNATTGTNGAYSFALPAPSTGRWWWRVTIPGTTAFLRSYGRTITTELL